MTPELSKVIDAAMEETNRFLLGYLDNIKYLRIREDWLRKALTEVASTALVEGSKRYGGIAQVLDENSFEKGAAAREQEILAALVILEHNNKTSDDYRVGEHWSTFGFPRAIEQVRTLITNRKEV